MLMVVDQSFFVCLGLKVLLNPSLETWTLALKTKALNTGLEAQKHLNLSPGSSSLEDIMYHWLRSESDLGVLVHDISKVAPNDNEQCAYEM